VRRGEHGVPGTRAAAPATPGRGTLATDCHARTLHAQYPLASTVAARAASRDRHAQSRPPNSVVALVPSQCQDHHSFSSTINFSIPSSLVFLSPFFIPVRCCAPRSPLCDVFGRTIEERIPATPPEGAGQTATDRPYGRSGVREAAGCVPLVGATRWFFEVAATLDGRSSLSFLTRLLAGGCSCDRYQSPIRASGTGWCRGLSPFLGANRWLCTSPAREAGRLDCSIFARHAAGRSVRNWCRLPTRAIALLWYRVLCLSIWGQPLGFTSGRHAG